MMKPKQWTGAVQFKNVIILHYKRVWTSIKQYEINPKLYKLKPS